MDACSWMSPPCSCHRLQIVMTAGLYRAVAMKKGIARRRSQSGFPSTRLSRCLLLQILKVNLCMKSMPTLSVEQAVWKGRERYTEFLEIHVVKNRDIVMCGTGRKCLRNASNLMMLSR